MILNTHGANLFNDTTVVNSQQLMLEKMDLQT